MGKGGACGGWGADATSARAPCVPRLKLGVGPLKEEGAEGEGRTRGAPGMLLGCALLMCASMAMRTEVLRPANEKLALLYLRMGILNLRNERGGPAVSK